MNRSLNDIACGGFFVVTALVFGTVSSGYDIGTATEMGPGFFPLLVCIIIGALGLAIIALALLGRTSDEEEAAENSASTPWVKIVTVLAACVFFGATVSGLGLVPSLAVAVFVASRAGANTWRQSIIMTVAIVTICAVVFQMALGLQVPLIGPWLV